MKLFPPTRSARIFILYVSVFLLVLAIMVLIYVLVGHQATGQGS